MSVDQLRGCEHPRIWTPPLRPLTPKTSLGFEAIEFGHDVLRASLFPWQRWLLIHGLELHPDFLASSPNPLFRLDTVIALAARQNGKTEDMKVLALYKMYLDRSETGKTSVIGTAQDLTNSEKAWTEAVEMAQDAPELEAEIEHVDLTNGKKSLRLTGNHSYMVKAASRRGARGFTGDLVMLDELREHQSWDAWGASTKTTLARPRSQVWCFSNAGDAASIVLWHLRGQALRSAEGVEPEELEAFTGVAPAAVDDEELGTSLGIFEWSAHPRVGVWDRSGWAQANPSLGYSITERKIAAAARTDPEWVFRTEVLCQWRPTAAGGPFPDGAWEAGIDPDSDVAPVGLISVGVAVSADGGMGYVAVAGNRVDGNVHVEVVAQRAGTEWLVPWLTSPERALRDRWGAVAWQLAGAPVSALTDALRATDLPCVDWTGPELGRASGMVLELVRLPAAAEPADAGKKRLFHLPQPVLDVPASTAAVKPAGDSWLIDLKRSPSDAAPLQAAFAAVWALGQVKAPFVSAYQDHDLLVV